MANQRMKIKLTYNAKFYNYVLKYRWTNFKFGVIQYVDFDTYVKWHKKREMILQIKQQYFNKYFRGMNVNKTAGSMLGFKHNANIKFESIHKYKLYIKIKIPYP